MLWKGICVLLCFTSALVLDNMELLFVQFYQKTSLNSRRLDLAVANYSVKRFFNGKYSMQTIPMLKKQVVRSYKNILCLGVELSSGAPVDCYVQRLSTIFSFQNIHPWELINKNVFFFDISKWRAIIHSISSNSSRNWSISIIKHSYMVLQRSIKATRRNSLFTLVAYQK